MSSDDYEKWYCFLGETTAERELDILYSRRELKKSKITDYIEAASLFRCQKNEKEKKFSLLIENFFMLEILTTYYFYNSLEKMRRRLENEKVK